MLTISSWNIKLSILFLETQLYKQYLILVRQYIMSCGKHCAHILIKLSPYQHLMSGCIVSLIASSCSINPQYLLFLSFSMLFWWIKLSPYQHQCCIVSLIASFCSINPQYLPFLSIFPHAFLVVSQWVSSSSVWKCMQAQASLPLILILKTEIICIWNLPTLTNLFVSVYTFF